MFEFKKIYFEKKYILYENGFEILRNDEFMSIPKGDKYEIMEIQCPLNLIKDYENTVKYLKLFKEKFPASPLIGDVNFSLAETYYLMKDWQNSILAYSDILNDKTIDKTKKELYKI